MLHPNFIKLFLLSFLYVSLNIFKSRNEPVKSETAQITVDYLAGVSIFLLSVAFVFQFMNGLFTPFQSNADDVTLSADRASTVLVERLISSDNYEGVNVVDEDKLNDFMSARLNSSNQTDYNNALLDVGLFSDETLFDLNVSVEELDGTIINQSGSTLPGNIDVGQTKRLVLITNPSTGYNQTAIISVRVW